MTPCAREANGLLLVAMLVMLAPAAVRGYPSLFVLRHAGGDCGAVPLQGYAGHGNPRADPALSLTVSDASTGAAISAVCPGANYTATAVFPAANGMRFLLTALPADGSSSWATPFDASCPNRAGTPARGGLAVHNTTNTLHVACNATGSLTLMLHAAAGPTDYFHMTQLTLPINPACASASCGGAGVGSGGAPPTYPGPGVGCRGVGSAAYPPAYPVGSGIPAYPAYDGSDDGCGGVGYGGYGGVGVGYGGYGGVGVVGVGYGGVGAPAGYGGDNWHPSPAAEGGHRRLQLSRLLRGFRAAAK